MNTGTKKTAALFVTCLIDNVSPDIGFSVAKLIEDAGYRLVVPAAQTCCGQPNYNGGDPKCAAQTARQVIDTFLPYDYVIVASGSCGGMIAHHYIELLKGDRNYADKARQLAEKTYELSKFLIDVAAYEPKLDLDAVKDKSVTYHDACAGLREMKVKSGPRALLQTAGFEIKEMHDAETCCGFGGTFCVKYPEISNKMVEQKVQNALASEAKTLVAGDLGCLLNMEGKIQRDGLPLKVKHYAELLAGAIEVNHGG